ncbi:hypothetical protein [Microbacterium sp. PRC9]|uniref:hypothetical protein n=1 Tax=Microbacterium sp. PRC9 TaxID=2962591 RepID=UPI002880EA3F|nr:hypothetical protein [Microbacterium sp. PRC9]MDT0143086.1 hypothetical protein [Microbacterium sp. PRC9]
MATEPTPNAAPGKRRFIPYPDGTARHFNASSRTPENWHNVHGLIEVYEIDGKLYNDLDEVERAMVAEAMLAKQEKRAPRMRDGRKRGGRAIRKLIAPVGSYEIVGD